MPWPRRDPVTYVAAAVSAVLTAIILAPLAAPGYWLLRDAVTTPRSYVTDGALGLGDLPARAVPQDWLVAVGSAVIDGGLLVKLLTALGLWLAGMGAARLLRGTYPTVGASGCAIAATVAIWNPYVAERLLQGHWSLLIGYGALYWVIEAARRESPWGVLGWCAVAGLTPTGSLLAVIGAVVAAPTWRRRAQAALLWFPSALPWLLATALSTAPTTSAAAGVDAFAARAEPGLGTVGSVAGLGGMWNADAVPTSRTTALALLATAALLALVLAGVLLGWRTAGPLQRRLFVMALVVVAVIAFAATTPGLSTLRWAVQEIPGTGLLRDTQKWVALALPLYAVAVPTALAALGRWAARTLNAPGAACAIGAAVVLVVLPLADLGWGVGNKISSHQYPASWRAQLAQLPPDRGAVLLLPSGTVRSYRFAGPVLDPIPRMTPAPVLTTGELIIDGAIVDAAPQSRAAQAAAAVGDDTRLARLGVGWVVTEGPTLQIHQVPGPIVSAQAARWRRSVMIAAHWVWLALIASGPLVALGRRIRSWRPAG